MLKTIIVTIALSFSFSLMLAQQGKVVKLYLNSDFYNSRFERMQNGLTRITANTSSFLQGFSPALMSIRESGRYSEWEWSSFRYGSAEFTELTVDSAGNTNILTGRQGFSVNTSFRYEYGFILNKLLGAPQKRVAYTVGLAIQPRLGTNITTPFTSDEFRSGRTYFGANFQFIPRLMFGGDKKWFVDVNFPISLGDVLVSRFRSDNPAFPLEFQRRWQQNLSLLPFNLQARLGVGIRI